jgi:ankyrin repeat protein
LSNPANRTLRLLRATEQGRFHVAKMLLAAGADVRAGGHSGETGLHSAAGGGQTEMVTYLLPLIGAVDVRDEFGGTPLHWAVRQHKIDVTRLLLEHGADPNAVDKHSQTPLHGAVGYRSLRPSEAASSIGREAHEASVRPEPATERSKQRQGAPEPQHADLRCDCDIAQLLLEGGANVNSKDGLSSTLLHAAARDGRLEMARLLLDSGAEVDARTAGGETPLHLAAEGGHQEMIRLLLRSGAAVNNRDSLGRTPLHRHLGSRCRRKEIVVLLLTSGANVNATDEQGRTVLHEAARHNLRAPLAELLRRHGARD